MVGDFKCVSEGVWKCEIHFLEQWVSVFSSLYYYNVHMFLFSSNRISYLMQQGMILSLGGIVPAAEVCFSGPGAAGNLTSLFPKL